MITLTLTTPSNAAGAVALIQLQGKGIPAMLSQLTGRDQWALGQVYLSDFAGIDQGLAVLLREDWAQIMPHGGLRVIELLCRKLQAFGCKLREASARTIYPEAASEMEADMLMAMALAPSPAAIDLLLGQQHNWQTGGFDAGRIMADTLRFDRLCTMPSIVVVGPANVGKSTLTNRMLGYAASIVADLPGTTRDWVGGMTQLRGVAVRWMDTPGIRSSDDAIEQHAITLAKQVIEQADVLIHMTDMQHGFESITMTSRQPDLHVLNKADHLDEASRRQLPQHILAISAATGLGLAELVEHILKHLGLHQLDATTKWAFSPKLKQILQAGDKAALKAYMQ